MNIYAKAALGALMLASASVGLARPATAQVDLGISFGFGDGIYGFDPCDYYDYYDQPPPWGLPDDYCDYPVFFEPVYFDGYWYRGPIYYRWNHGRRLFWLNGGWRDTHWTGSPPQHIRWENRGGHFRNGFRPGIGFHGGGRDWRADGVDGHRWHDNGNDEHGRQNGGGEHRPWMGGGGDHPWFGNHGGGERGGDRGTDPRGGRGGDRGGDRGGGHFNGGGDDHGGGHGDSGGGHSSGNSSGGSHGGGGFGPHH